MKNEICVVVNSDNFNIDDFRDFLRQKKSELNEKYAHWLEGVDDAEEKKELEIERENIQNNLTIVFQMSKLGYSVNTFSYITNFIKELENEHIKRVSLSILDGNSLINKGKMPVLLSQNEVDFIKKLEDNISSNEFIPCKTVGIREMPEENDNSLDTLIRANLMIDRVANEIIKNNFSPFEAVAYAHRFCTSFFYSRGDGSTGCKTADNLINSGAIVCVGYATLFKTILDKANVKGLKVGLNALFSKKTGSGHANNYVEIDDPKYNINGIYVNDCTNDAVDEKFNGTFANCLISLKDLDAMYNPYFYGKTGIQMNEYVDSNLMCKFRKHLKLDDRSLSKQKIDHLKYIEMSSPEISLSKFRDCLDHIIRKTNSNSNLEEIISQSIQRSAYLYHSYAGNCFRKAALELGVHKRSSEETLLERQLRNMDLDEYFSSRADKIRARLDEIRDLKSRKDDICAEKNRKTIEELFNSN